MHYGMQARGISIRKKYPKQKESGLRRTQHRILHCKAFLTEKKMPER